MPNKYSQETATETLADGESISVVLYVGNADYVSTLVGDGDEGAPPTHDIAWHQRPVRDDPGEDGDQWMATADPTDENLKSTTTAWWLDEVPAPTQWRATVTNQSGDEATVQLRVVAHGGGI